MEFRFSLDAVYRPKWRERWHHAPHALFDYGLTDVNHKLPKGAGKSEMQKFLFVTLYPVSPLPHCGASILLLLSLNYPFLSLSEYVSTAAIEIY